MADELIERVKTILGNAAQGNWDAVRQHVSEDIVVNLPAGLPYGGVCRGWDAYVKTFKDLWGFFTDLKVASSEMIQHGDRVIIINNMSAKLARNGKPVTLLQTSIWQFKDGKLVTVTPYYHDTKTIMDIYAQD